MNHDPGSSIITFDESRISAYSVSMSGSPQNSQDAETPSIFESFFPVIDELTRSAPPNSIIIFISAYIASLQFLISSFFPYLRSSWDFSERADKVVRYISYINDFGCADPDVFQTMIPSIFVLVFDLAIIIYLLSVVIYFKLYKTFFKFSMYITRFIFSILVPLMLLPTSSIAGFSFSGIFIYSEAKAANVIITCFAVIFFIILLLTFYVESLCRSSTPYLENTILAMWDGLLLVLFLFAGSCAIFFSRFIYFFPGWAKYFLVGFFDIFVAVTSYRLTLFPMIYNWVNVSFFNISVSGIFASLIHLLPISSLYRVTIPFIFLVISYPVEYVIFLQLRKKVAEKQDISTPGRILRTLRVCIADKCEEFVSWKLIKSIVSKPQSTSILSRIAQMVSFFPSEHQQLNLYISLLSRRNDMAFHEKFMFYQIKRVHVLRQSSTSKQVNEDLDKISKMTDKAISLFSSFLLKAFDDRQNLSMDSLSTLSSLNRITNSSCIETLEKYPNNSRLAYEYSKYLIECHADYKNGIKYNLIGLQIENGKRPIIDCAFRTMVNLFPNYLTNRILDYKGRIILNRRRGRRSGSSISSNSSRMSEADFDIEDSKDREASIIDKPRLRFVVQKAVSKMQSSGIKIILFSIFFRFIASILICVIMYSLKTNHYDSRHDNFDIITQFGISLQHTSYTALKIAHHWAERLGIMHSRETLLSTLDLGENCSHVQNPDFCQCGDKEISFFYGNTAGIDNFTVSSDIDEMVKASEYLGLLISLFSTSENQYMYNQIISAYLNEHTIVYCTDDGSILHSIQGSFRHFMYYLATRLDEINNYDQLEDPEQWSYSNGVCEITTNIFDLFSHYEKQSLVYVDREEIAHNEMRQHLNLELSISIPLVFIVYIIPIIWGFYKMVKEFNYIFDVLSLMPLEIYKQAAKPIAIFSSSQNSSSPGNEDVTINMNTVNPNSAAKTRRFAQILPPFFAVLSTVIICISLFSYVYEMSLANNDIINLNHWQILSSQRIPSLIESILATYFSVIFGYLQNYNYTNPIINLNYQANASLKLLNAHHTLLWGNDNFESCNNFDERLDSVHYNDLCSLSSGGSNIHMGYSCLSADQMIIAWSKFSNDVITMINNTKTPDEFSKVFSSPTFIHYQHIGIAHLLYSLESAQQILNNGMNFTLNALQNHIIIITVLTILASLIIFIIEILLIHKIFSNFNILRILIARLPPTSIVNNNLLIEIITGNISETFGKVTPKIAYMQNANNAIIVVNDKSNIVSCNKATTLTFGYTKEQIQNKPIDLLFVNNPSNINQIRSVIHSLISDNLPDKDDGINGINNVYHHHNNNMEDNYIAPSNIPITDLYDKKATISTFNMEEELNKDIIPTDISISIANDDTHNHSTIVIDSNDKNANSHNPEIQNSSNLVDNEQDQNTNDAPNQTDIDHNHHSNHEEIDNKDNTISMSKESLFDHNEPDGHNENIKKKQKGRLDSHDIRYFTLVGSKDDGSHINLDVVALYIKPDNVIVFELKDITRQMTKSVEAEKEKQKIENLIEQVLPSPIIDRIISKDKNICFSAKIVTCIMIKLYNLDEIIPSLAGYQVNNHLTTIFKTFDALRSNYSLIIKMNIINNACLLISGIFNQDLDPKEPALEAISYSLECLRILDDINQSIDSNLMVDIAIHTGGPLTIGVLGKDALLFDAFGDPISMVNELSSESNHGALIITDNTYQYVKDNNDLVIIPDKPFHPKNKPEMITYYVDFKNQI